MRIDVDDLTSAETIEFLEDHVTQLRAISPPESTHALDLEGLRAPGVRFWSARDGDRVVGCAALKHLDDGHAEVKSMRTAADRARQGVASGLLGVVIEHAREAGFRRLSLETGTEEFFAPARALYARHGFVECRPFADYRPDPLSVFMTLSCDLVLDVRRFRHGETDREDRQRQHEQQHQRQVPATRWRRARRRPRTARAPRSGSPRTG